MNRARVYLRLGRVRTSPRWLQPLIAGISLVDGAAVALRGGPLAAVLACVAGFGLTLRLQRRVAGT